MADNNNIQPAIPLPEEVPVITEQLPPEVGFDPLGEVGDPLAIDESQELPLTNDTAQQVADIYNMAGIGTLTRPVVVADVLNQYSNYGNADLKALLGNIGAEDEELLRDNVRKAISNPDVSVEDRVALAKEISGYSDIDFNAIQRQAAHNANIMENSGDTPEAEADYQAATEVAESIPTSVTAETPLPASIDAVRAMYENALNQVYSQADENSGTTDFLGSMVPFRYQVPVARIYNALGLNEKKEGTLGVGGNILTGEMLKQIRQHVESLPPKQKTEAVNTVLNILTKNAGMFGDGNDYVTMHVLQQVFHKDLMGGDYDDSSMFGTIVGNLLPTRGAQKKAQEELGGISGTQIIDNFTSILDMVGLGSLAKTTISFGSKWMPKSLTNLRKVAPDMATRTAADALDNEAIRLKFPNMQPEDVVNTFLPASGKAMQEGGFNGMGELVSRQLDIRDRLLRISERTNMNAAERADAFAEIKQIYGDIGTKPFSTMHINESVFTEGVNSAHIEAIFGRTKSKPFSSLKEAYEASLAEIERTFGKDADVSVVWRNPKTGVLEPIPKGMKPSKKGEFFIRAVDDRTYESAPSAYHSLVMGEKEVANLSFGASKWKRLRGITNLLSKDAADNIRLASRQRTEWNKLTAGLYSDVAKLSTKESRILSTVLKEGEKVDPKTGMGRTYGPQELRDLGMTEDGVRAYYASRNAMDIMYEAVNRETRSRMLRDGVKDIHTSKGRVGYAQPRRVQDALADVGESSTKMDVYDAATNTFSQIDRAEIQQLYGRGQSLARLEQPMLGKGGYEATHVVINNKSGVRVLELPRRVVTKVEGYYPHMWKGNYVVFGMTKGGRQYALGLAANEADAKAAAARYNTVIAKRAAKGKENRFSEVRWNYDRSLNQDVGRRGSLQEDIYQNMGGPVYGHRNGGELANFSKAAGDIMVDPVEAMLRGMEIVGSKVTKGELATYMRQKAYQFAKQEGVLRDVRNIPFSKEDLVFHASKREAYNKASLYLDSIDNMLNMRDAVDEDVSKFFLAASGITSRLGAKSLATRLAKTAARRNDPMSAIMGLMHRTTIATAPLGQGALQAAQSLMMLGVSPVNYIKAVRQTGVVAMLIGMRSSVIHAGKAGLTETQLVKELDTIAKMAGMEVGEVRQIVDTIMESGLVSAVGYHTQMRNAIRSAAEERMMQTAATINKPMGAPLSRFARAADAQTFGLLSRYGFEAGESINQIATFLTLYNRDKVKGVANLANPDYVKKLVGSVAELTGDMIPETGFTYQRGWFKAAMQFVSFQHKMILLMMPERLGGAKSLTAAEKAGMVFAQFLLFGRRGAAHMDSIYRVVDAKIRDQAADEGEETQLYQAWNHPTTRAVMDGLVFDTAGNFVLKEVFGEETPDMALSERFSPGGGSEFMADRLFAIASNPTKAFFGLGGEKIGKLAHFMKRVGDITLANVRGHDDEYLDERFAEMAKSGAVNLFSIYNRYVASKAAERMDGWVSSGGAVTEGFSGPLEGILYTQFGITTKDRESLYAAMDKFKEQTITEPGFKQKNLDEVVDQYYRDLITEGVKFNSQAVDDNAYNVLMDKWVRERGLIFSILPPEDAEYISEKVQERLQKAALGQGDSAESALVERLTKDIRDGRFGAEGPDVALYLQEAPFVKDNPKLNEIVRQAWIEATTDDYLENK